MTRITRRKTHWLWLAGILLESMLAVGGASVPTQRQITLDAMDRRPLHFWPRSLGHVVLGWPGSRDIDKGYHEPGGSFSPGAGSFGLSLLVLDPQNQVLATSDSLPLDQIRQRWEWLPDQELPAIRTETPSYTASWSIVRPGLWQLHLQTRPAESNRICLALRSVGPAGGPVRVLEWRDHRLMINRRWIVATDPLLTTVSGGTEESIDWMTARRDLTNWVGTNGWGCAVLTLPGRREWTVQVADPSSPATSGLRFTKLQPLLQISVPEPWFVESIKAQTALLAMSLVGWETRPMDPLSLPVHWTSDSAYIVAALARAGQLDIARQLCRSLCEPDFAGGYGPEADAPGLALWGLNEVAGRVRDPSFKQAVWPHVVRKVEGIQRMRAASRPVTANVPGPRIPQFAQHPELNRVCDPARDGLIHGRVDWQRPVLYVNAVSYLGLLNAVAMADWVGNAGGDAIWLAQAADIRTSWNIAAHSTQTTEEHAGIAGLWPSWIVTDKPAYAQLLNQRWESSHDSENRRKNPPSRSAFALAEAHQWLYLRRPDRVWSELEWFHEHQASPGLYTWSDRPNLQNAFHRWDAIRGWIKPPHNTPDYRIAAEMLHLLLDMLVYVDESESPAVLVIGEGVPASWLTGPLSVQGLSTRLGLVDWTWDKQIVRVRVRGNSCPVRLGAEFPPGVLRTQFLRP
ncbi:MAG TPA: hypothetical protein P5186_29415 [Candidatus Paceibacterota bacterium]|nr:hypothetical protein [Verrucomicrobiota bacterium]HRY52167.1 hypothetical protein [Candidatus Paceibacterota bacterium]HSA01977.1 hypothetical protein [Candidatus Paceibacterota bacterium]